MDFRIEYIEIVMKLIDYTIRGWQSHLESLHVNRRKEKKPIVEINLKFPIFNEIHE